jgi:hypothetical protein
MSVPSICFIAALSAVLLGVFTTSGFQTNSALMTASTRGPPQPQQTTVASMSQKKKDDDDVENSKPKNFLDDLKGMFQNFDDVVDDFVYKRMGAGEQWYGKRKYNPSGRVDGDYNGMGRSDYFRIEIARVQKEEMELRKQRRLEEEEARKRRI